MRYITITLLILISTKSVAQPKKYFSETPDKIKNYRFLSQVAWNRKDSIKAQSYYDSITKCIENSYIDDYNFQKIDGKFLNTRQVDKPIFILTSASWCLPCMAEIKPLNKIVEQYADSVQFIVLFWDTKGRLDKISNKYNSKIALISSSSREKEDGDSISLSGFKHIGGYPATYLIKDKKIIHYSEGAASTSFSKLNSEGKVETFVIATEEAVFAANYKLLKSKIEKLLKSGRN